jgi:RES domain-containing protein
MAIKADESTAHRWRSGDSAPSSIFYRQCAPEHTDLATTLAYNHRHGGRFNPPGEFGAIYVSVERATALRELGP